MRVKNKTQNVLSISFHRSVIVFSIMLLFMQVSCKKLVSIDPPVNSITTIDAFSDSIDANSAILGVYSNLINTDGGIFFGSSGITIFTGLSSDELVYFFSNPAFDQFYNNLLLANNSVIYPTFWSQPYSYIYQVNACIEGINASKGISPAATNQFIGEAKFLRALFYFYLVNTFGDVPYVTSTTYFKTDTASRTPKDQVYQYIIDDLTEAKAFLSEDYNYSGGERVRANRWAATALLARVYLYTKNWEQAEQQASAVINQSATFSLVNNPNEVFLQNSQEAILQWQINTSVYPYNNTPEGYNFIPYDSFTNPSFYVSNNLLDAFETGDARKDAWLSSTNYEGTVYYYPYKYKLGPAQAVVNGTPSEYYMVLRLAEQYLIRAEARAMLNKIGDAQSDINTIRARAGLPATTAADQTQLLAAIAHERQVELFAEWGHRWFDLKRTDQATKVLSPIKNKWTSDAQLYPIPSHELLFNPNMTQNEGY